MQTCMPLIQPQVKFIIMGNNHNISSRIHWSTHRFRPRRCSSTRARQAVAVTRAYCEPLYKNRAKPRHQHPLPRPPRRLPHLATITTTTAADATSSARTNLRHSPIHLTVANRLRVGATCPPQQRTYRHLRPTQVNYKRSAIATCTVNNRNNSIPPMVV